MVLQLQELSRWPTTRLLFWFSENDAAPNLGFLEFEMILGGRWSYCGGGEAEVAVAVSCGHCISLLREIGEREKGESEGLVDEIYNGSGVIFALFYFIF